MVEIYTGNILEISAIIMGAHVHVFPTKNPKHAVA